MTAPNHFLPLQPANLNDGSLNAVDAETGAALERQRDRILDITNYLEALYAQLLVSKNGRPSITAVGGGRSQHGRRLPRQA